MSMLYPFKVLLNAKTIKALSVMNPNPLLKIIAGGTASTITIIGASSGFNCFTYDAKNRSDTNHQIMRNANTVETTRQLNTNTVETARQLLEIDKERTKLKSFWNFFK